MNIRNYLPPVVKTRRTAEQIRRRFVAHRWMERQPDDYAKTLPGMLITAGFARRVGTDLFEFDHDPSPHALNLAIADNVGMIPSVKEFQEKWETQPWFRFQMAAKRAAVGLLGVLMIGGGCFLVRDLQRTGIKARAISYLSQPERCLSCGIKKVWHDAFKN